METPNVIYLNFKKGDPLDGSWSGTPLVGEGWTNVAYVKMEPVEKIVNEVKEAIAAHDAKANK